MASSVELDPVPAITGILPFDSLTHNSITLSCSLWFKVGDSPVVPAGTNYTTINVLDINDVPLEKARVTLLNADESIFITKLTDSNGNATFDLDQGVEGNVTLTVTKQNHIPFQDNFNK